MNEFFGNARWIQAAAGFLRYEVFVLEQKIPAALEFDALDTVDRNYWLLLEKQRPIATIRYQQIDEKTVNPDRLCVAEAFREKGLGTRALAFVEKQAQTAGCRVSVVSAEVTAQAFYQKNGYHVVSAPYLEDGILCVKMKKDLA